MIARTDSSSTCMYVGRRRGGGGLGLLGGGSTEKRWHAAAAPVTRSGQETTESAEWRGQIVLALRHTACARSSDRASAAAAAARAYADKSVIPHQDSAPDHTRRAATGRVGNHAFEL